MTAHGDKEHKGEIRGWHRAPCQPGLGYYVMGTFSDHPELAGRFTNTSYVLRHDWATGEIETRNSLYRLVGEERTTHGQTR